MTLYGFNILYGASFFFYLLGNNIPLFGHSLTVNIVYEMPIKNYQSRCSY